MLKTTSTADLGQSKNQALAIAGYIRKKHAKGNKWF